MNCLTVLNSPLKYPSPDVTRAISHKDTQMTTRFAEGGRPAAAVVRGAAMKVKTEPVKAADSGDTADGALAVKDMSVSCLNFTPENLADVQLICQRDIQ